MMTRPVWTRLGLGAVAALTSLVALAPIAHGADPATPSERLVIREIDATAYPTMTVVTQQSAPGAPAVLLNGVAPAGVESQSIDQSSKPFGVVYVLDVTKAMFDSGAYAAAREAILAHVSTIAPNERIAVVFGGVTARVATDFTTDAVEITGVLDGLAVSDREEASPYDAVLLAVRLFDQAPELQPNIVVVTASSDAGLGISRSAIRGDLLNKSINLSIVGLEGKNIDLGPLFGLARDSGGKAFSIDATAKVGPALTDVRAFVRAQRVTTFNGPAEASALDVSVTVGGSSATGYVNAGDRVQGLGVSPPGVHKVLDSGPSFLRGNQGKLIGVSLAAIACVLFALGLGLIVVREKSGLDSVLSHYGEDKVTASSDDEADGSMATSQILQRAVEFTSRVAEQRGVITWFEGALERADLPLRAGEALFFYIAIAVVCTAASFVLSGQWIVMLIVAVMLSFAPPVVLGYLAKRRQKKFQAMLPDMLNLLSSTLKAGYSLMQGIEAVSREVADPVGKELRRIVVESRLGRPLEESMRESAERMQSDDFKWAVMAIGIQREVGGNLSELLLTVADTMVQRERLRRDVQSLTAEGRISALVLIVLPPGVGMAMYSLNKDYIMTLFREPTGHIMLGVAGVMMVGGWFWMKKMIKVEV
jgi:tight adherence protein B